MCIIHICIKYTILKATLVVAYKHYIAVVHLRKILVEIVQYH